MEGDLHKDNLDDFFKNRLQEDTDLPSENGWDIPSEQVWTSVNQAIDQADEPAPSVFWLNRFRIAGVLVVALSLLASLFFYFSKPTKTFVDPSKPPIEQPIPPTNLTPNETNPTDRVEVPTASTLETAQEIVEQPTSPKNQSSTKSIVQKDIITPIPNNFDPATDLFSDAQKNSPKSSTDINPQNSKPEAQETKLADDNLSNNITDPGEDLMATSNTTDPVATDKQGQIATPSVPQEQLKILAPIPTKLAPIVVQTQAADTIAHSNSPFIPLERLVEKARKIKGFYAGFMLAPAYTDRKIKIIGNPVIARAINQDEAPDLSFITGATVGYKFTNNWSIESGFSYAQFSLQHRGQKQVRYTTVGEEMTASGNFEKQYSLDVGTSGGDVGTEIGLSRSPNTSIPENDFIPLFLKAKQNITFGNIPIIVRYQVGNDKWSFGLKAGVLNRFVLDGYLEIESVEVLRPGVQPILNDRIYKKRPLQKINNYELDLLVGAGVNYHVTSKIWLAVEPTFTHSINPIFENRFFQTFPITGSLDISLNYLF